MRHALLALLFALPCAAPAADRHPFDVHDLVSMARVSDPRVSPNDAFLAYVVRETDLAADKGVRGVWLLDLKHPGAPAVRLTAAGADSQSPRWAMDGRSIFFLSDRSSGAQVWRLDLTGGEARQVTKLPVDVNNFAVSPNGRQLLLSLDVFTDCDTLACTRKRLDERAKSKAQGRLYDKLFVRHWDAWSDGRRAQLFVIALVEDGAVTAEPKWITKGIDGDVPSKPFGDDTEYAFSPDGKTVYFDVRIAGKSEPWSTNFDIYQVPADGSRAPQNLTAANAAWDGYPLASHDGRTLYYLAMKRPGFEADRFGIMAIDLRTGATRELDPGWDRSAGPLALARDGRTLYTTADDNGEHPLFAVEAGTGKVRKLAGGGTVDGFDLTGEGVVYGLQTLTSPTDLFRVAARGGTPSQLTRANDERLAQVEMGDYAFFTFKGWHDEIVQGYVVKPAGYESGRKYPIAFLIHGGPQGAWTNEFHYRWNPQTYAGQGYAVVAINFHGSTGYGQAFTDSISGDWGGKPLEDLKRGYAAVLAKYDFLDAARACALGASYGGYMIDWIAGNWNEPWKCLVSHDGVFDSRLMYYATDELWFDEWEHGGPQFEKPENFERDNPLNFVRNWQDPILVIHSGHDYRVTLDQGLGAFTAAQRRGIPSEFLYYDSESHWVQKPHDSIQWHEAVQAWLERWLK